MRFQLLFALPFLALPLRAQDFIQSPYQNLSLASPIVTDFTGDGWPDVFGIQFFFGSTNNVVFRANNGTTAIDFTDKPLGFDFDAQGYPDGGDIDGDGDTDIAVAKTASLNLFLLLNDGSGNFTETPLNLAGADLLKIADIDNDLDKDIVGLNTLNGTLNLYINNGSQVFTQKNLLPATADLEHVAVGDLDGDGDVDIVLGFDSFSGKQVSVMQNNGAAGFSEAVLGSSLFFSFGDLSIADINSDGKKDIIVGGGVTCLAFLNQGSMTFNQKSLVSVTNYIRSIRVGDFNGDGRADLVVGTNSEGVTWHKNLDNATLQFESKTVGGIAPAFSIDKADLDKDGDDDLVISNGEFWWYENKVVQEPSATAELQTLAVFVYPNPFHETVNLERMGQELHHVRVTDMAGRVSHESTEGGNEVDLPKLPAGAYILTLSDLKGGLSKSFFLIKSE